MIDGRGDSEGAWTVVGMVAADGEGAAAERERARRGWGAIAPVDAGAIVAADGTRRIAAVGLRSSRIGERRHRLVGQGRAGDEADIHGRARHGRIGYRDR